MSNALIKNLMHENKKCSFRKEVEFLFYLGSIINEKNIETNTVILFLLYGNLTEYTVSNKASYKLDNPVVL